MLEATTIRGSHREWHIEGLLAHRPDEPRH
jgi:hypothetical protein